MPSVRCSNQRRGRLSVLVGTDRNFQHLSHLRSSLKLGLVTWLGCFHLLPSQVRPLLFARYVPLTPWPARNLDKKVKFISQVIYPTFPWKNSGGTTNPPGPNVFLSASASDSELLDIVAGLFCSSMVIFHRKTLLVSSKTTFEVRDVFYMPRRL